MTTPDDPISLRALCKEWARWRPEPLRFPASIEVRFRQARKAARLDHFIRSGIVALLIFNLFLVTDWMMVPDVFEASLQLRLWVFTPIAASVIAFGILARRWVLENWPAIVPELVVLASGLFAAASMVFNLVSSSSPYAVLYTAGLIPIVVYGNLVQRFRFSHALGFSILVCVQAAYVTGHPNAAASPYAHLAPPLCLFVVAISVYTLAMNYRMELEERRRFMGFDRAQNLRMQLEASRAEFERLSRLDALTGIANRRHVDELLADRQRAGAPAALLLVDVDHFKSYNDRYGHPAGDQCLRHVAQALSVPVVEAGGVLARWGGEEFVVLLSPGTAEQAGTLADALCRSVVASGLRHEASDVATVVTVSVGVAATARLTSADHLLGLADDALYEAKRAGRNRWVSRVPPSAAGAA